MMNIQPALFHIEEIAFGNIELACVMKYRAPPPHVHISLWAHILAIQKISYLQTQSCMR